MGKQWKQCQTLFFWAPKSLQMVTAAMKSKDAYSLDKTTKIMASGPITSWQIDGETEETVTDFMFLGSKITADGDCSHEIKRHLLLGCSAAQSRLTLCGPMHCSMPGFPVHHPLPEFTQTHVHRVSDATGGFGSLHTPGP